MKASKKTKSLSQAAGVKVQKATYDLPSHDALAQILPNYQHVYKGAKTEVHNTGQQQQQQQEEEEERLAERHKLAHKSNINHTYQVHHPHKRPPLHDFEDDPLMAQITDLQTKEVENYRLALSKMAEDIIALRTQVVMLEAENSQLRINLSLHWDQRLARPDNMDIDSMTKTEIADLIASLRFELASETSKAASQWDRIQQLQNDLIKKNDSEKELLKLQRVQQQQEEDLHHHQGCLRKMVTLEATVKQQEKIIEKMQKALDSKLREENKQSGDKRLVVKKQTGDTDHEREEIQSALVAENSRLRQELDRMGQQPTEQPSAQTKDALPFKERLSLLNKVEMAEARAQTLEVQLEENSKLWGRQKQDMLTKLGEHRHGFVRTSTTILHNVPAGSVSAASGQKNTQRMQKPEQ